MKDEFNFSVILSSLNLRFRVRRSGGGTKSRIQGHGW